MRWTLARKSASAPAELAFFVGTMNVAQVDEGFFLVPGVSFFQSEAFVFPALADAFTCADLLNLHALGVAGLAAGFMPLPHLGEVQA